MRGGGDDQVGGKDILCEQGLGARRVHTRRRLVSRPRTGLPATLWALLAALGIAGVVLGHAIGYWLAHPHAHGRHLVLAASGHGYWALAIPLAILGAVIALLGQAALGAFRGGTPPSSSARPTVVGVFVRLSAVQIGIFVALELGERLVGGAGMPWAEVAFWLGLPIQVLVAGTGAVALRGAEEVGTRLARAHRYPKPRRGRARLLLARGDRLRSRAPGGRRGARAPPAAVGID